MGILKATEQFWQELFSHPCCREKCRKVLIKRCPPITGAIWGVPMRHIYTEAPGMDLMKEILRAWLFVISSLYCLETRKLYVMHPLQPCLVNEIHLEISHNTVVYWWFFLLYLRGHLYSNMITHIKHPHEYKIPVPVSTFYLLKIIFKKIYLKM